MAQPYLVVCGLLLVAAVLVRALPLHRSSRDSEYEDGFDLTARELGLLRRGRYGVVLTVLAQLHGEGAVDLSWGRRVRRLDPPRDCDDRLALAIYAGLNHTRWPRLLALLPSVRRQCRPLRQELRDRRLRPTTRRWLFATMLQVYAISLALATLVEQSARGSTVSATLVVAALAGAVSVAPRRTVAGWRELRIHRAALARLSESGDLDGSYLGDLVAAHGNAAVDTLCGPVIRWGGLARPRYGRLVPPTTAPVPTVIEAGLRDRQRAQRSVVELAA
jgi:uncharacterized protein (TIGR04222 family)